MILTSLLTSLVIDGRDDNDVNGLAYGIHIMDTVVESMMR